MSTGGKSLSQSCSPHYCSCKERTLLTSNPRSSSLSCFPDTHPQTRSAVWGCCGPRAGPRTSLYSTSYHRLWPIKTACPDASAEPSYHLEEQYSLFPPFKIMNFTISWSLKTRLPLTFPSPTWLQEGSTKHWLGIWHQETSGLVMDSCVVLTAGIKEFEVLLEDQVLWMWGYFEQILEGLTHQFFLVKWPTTDTHYCICYPCCSAF